MGYDAHSHGGTKSTNKKQVIAYFDGGNGTSNSLLTIISTGDSVTISLLLLRLPNLPGTFE